MGPLARLLPIAPRLILAAVAVLLLSTSVSAAEVPKVKDLVVVACDETTLYGWLASTNAFERPLNAEVWKLPDGWRYRPEAARETIGVLQTFCISVCTTVGVRLEKPLVGGAEYLVRLHESDGAILAAGFLDTTGSATLSQLPMGEQGRQMLAVAAPVRIAHAGDLRLGVTPESGATWEEEDVELLNPLDSVNCAEELNPRGLGRVHVEADFSAGGSALAGSKLTLIGLRGPFGALSPTGKYVAAVPKSEKEAEYYFALSYLGSDEKPDVFGLDLKIAPALRVRGPWQLGPRLVADLAQNADSPNSATLGFFARHSSFVEAGPIEQSTWSFGVGAEADRDLDRVNGVFETAWLPRLPALEHSRELRRAREAKRLGVAVSEVPLPVWGWGLEPKVGVEIGRSLRRQTFRDTDSGQRLEVEGYDILRPFTGVHGYLERNRWSLDVTGTLRYLSEDELAVRTAADETLFLHVNEGYEPYVESKISYALDPAGHQVLELTYKNGGLPPTFERTDAFSIGFAVKY
jgi:hypothetical protein